MNFLSLCQRGLSECGEQGSMTTTSGAIGSHARIVNWIGDAWNEIQTAHDDWDWLRSSSILGGGISFTTTSGLATYPLGTGAGTVGVLADNFGKWDRETFRCFTTTAGNINDPADTRHLTQLVRLASTITQYAHLFTSS